MKQYLLKLMLIAFICMLTMIIMMKKWEIRQDKEQIKVKSFKTTTVHVRSWCRSNDADQRLIFTTFKFKGWEII